MLVIVGSRREGNSYNLGQKIKSACDAERIFPVNIKHF